MSGVRVRAGRLRLPGSGRGQGLPLRLPGSLRGRGLPVRLGAFHALVRVALVCDAVLLGALVRGTGDDASSTGVGWLVLCCLLACALVPRLPGLVPAVALLAFWMLLHPAVGGATLAGVVVLVWLAHRLVCWTAVGPGHTTVGDDAVRLLVADAAREGLWVAGLAAVLVLGSRLARVLPASPWWAWLLLGLAVAVVLAALTTRRE